jgi:hypothetical protein
MRRGADAIQATDMEDAAAMAAEAADQESGEPATEQCVWIEDPDTDEIVEFVVLMEMVPSYRATRTI